MTEPARLGRLRELLVLDTAPEPIFDRLTRMASQLCGTPIALVSLIDAERQWFKSNVGLTGINETPRDVAFCAHAIQGDDLLEIADAREDDRFAANPLVTGEPQIRFYAGAPLVLQSGARIGTLCVIDREPRGLDAGQKATLRELAALVTEALEMRRGLLAKSMATRSKVQEALLQSEAQYRAIVEDQAELVSIANSAGELEFVNRAYAAHFDLDPQDMLGKRLYDFVDAADRQAVEQRIRQVIDTGNSVSSENRMVAAHGTTRWVAWTNSLYRDPTGQGLLLSVGRDVSDKKQAEIDLRTSQSLLTRTGRVAGVGGWELDLASQAIVWTEETKRIHEVSSDYVPQLENALAFYTEESRPRIEAAVRLGIDHGQPWDLELQLITARGRKIWARAVGEAEFEAGRAVRLVGAFQDISQRKELESRAVESERFLLQIADSLPIRISYVDRGGRYRFVNNAHVKRFGRDRKDILGRKRDELLAMPMGDAIAEKVSAVLAGQPQRFEFDEPHPNGVYRIESQLTPDIDERGLVRGFFSTGVDITERARVEQALRDLSAIVERTTDFVVQTDWKGRILYMNPAVRALTGMGESESLSERNFTEFNTEETNRLFASVIVPALEKFGVWSGETTVYGADRLCVPVSHLVIAHRDAGGRISRYSAVMRDIRVEVRAKDELLRQAATLRSVAEAIPAIMAVVGIDGRYRFVNSTFERWAGAQRETIVGKTLVEVLGRVEFERSKPYIERVFAGETVSFEKAYLQGGRHTHLAISYVPLWLSNECVDGFVAVAQDITAHRQESVRLANLAQQDPLTGLLNRAGFEEFIQQALAGDQDTSVALICIDLDRFKVVNDTHGHPAGDAVLRAIAQRLRSLVRPGDAVARLGGDEFAVALVGIGLESRADAIAQKVVAAAAVPVTYGETALQVGASAGVAFASALDGWDALLERADAMLYRAKGAGRGCHAVEHTDLAK